MHPCPALDYRLKTSSKTTFLKDPVILSHVCSRWRRIAISTADLWSHIDINLAEINLLKTSARLNVYMGRSTHALLDIHIAQNPWSRYEPYYSPSEANPTITDLLTVAAPRIRNLTLSVPHNREKVYRSFLATCFTNYTPNTLARISLRSVGLDCNHNIPFLGNTNNLLPGQIDWSGFHPKLSRRYVRTGKGYHGLAELRLVKVGSISQPRLRDVLQSNPSRP
ncbi:hypothetical protein B0J17DRAFT_684124 [Rhizoctonia solani]|nr:hypothetical protein B0J17DRAFT_684124 [Rhizoctonia solani]